MSARESNRTQGTSTYRQALRSAMSVYLTAPFFGSWNLWILDHDVRAPHVGRPRTCSTKRC